MIKQLIEKLEEHFDEAWGRVKGEDDFFSGKATGLELAIHIVKQLEQKVRCGNCNNKTDNDCKHKIIVAGHTAPSWGMFGCILWEEKK